MLDHVVSAQKTDPLPLQLLRPGLQLQTATVGPRAEALVAKSTTSKQKMSKQWNILMLFFIIKHSFLCKKLEKGNV